jgi:transposase-like protein
MSNPFEITAQASTRILPSTLNPAILAPRPGPKPKPLAERSLYNLQLARHDPIIISATTDGLLAQFKANTPTELDSDSNKSHDIRRRSYTREQKLAAVGYAATKRVCQKGEMVLISHRQACKDLGLKPVQLRDWKKNVDKIRSLTKGSRRGTLTHIAHFLVLEDRLHTLILEKRRLGRNIGEKWIRRHTRLEYESLWPERVTIVEKRKVFAGIVFSAGWFNGFLKRKHLSPRASTKRAQVVPADYKDKITSWLQFNRRAQARCNFELLEIANMDQTPIAFEFLDKRTYDTTGIKTVFLKQTGSGWDRRQATLQILVHADSIQRCKPLLIFHGKNEDHRQKPKSGPLRHEYRLYDSRVEVSVVLKYYSSLVLISSR